MYEYDHLKKKKLADENETNERIKQDSEWENRGFFRNFD